MAQDAGNAVLPASRFTAEKHMSFVRKYMPEDAAVTATESWLRPRYLERSVHLLSFAMAGLIPPFTSFFHDVLDFHEIHTLHLTPNAVIILAIFVHLCEMFIRVRLSMRLFQYFFIPQLQQPTMVGGCYFQPHVGVMGQYIESHLRKQWDDYKRDWGLWSWGLTAVMVFGDYFRHRIVPLQEQSRGAWAYTRYNDPMRTHVGERREWSEEDARAVGRDRDSILAVMMAVGTARGRGRRATAGGGRDDGAGNSSAGAGGSQVGGSSGGGGSSRVSSSSHGASTGPAADPMAKWKVSGSEPPSPPYRLATAQDALATLERLTQGQAGEIGALRLANDVGPGLHHDAIERLEHVGRRVGISRRWDEKLPATRPALAHRLDETAINLEKLQGEVDADVRSSSASLARAAVEVILASYQVRNSEFLP
uniref:Retrotransposon protein, putative, unclassified n=1 Tax=Oryza sativa subsp. japonica TaxID=39947 RepID=Q2QT80_ORYSJ|nr:retrotransposon protein, putative, unclassified [Oryza sativa Japonica Group]